MEKADIRTSADAIDYVRERHSQTMLAFSCGKDSIAAWLAIRAHFERVIPYYLYLVPGLEFVDESLDYYERWFGVRIARLPHPSLHRWLCGGFVFAPPERIAVLTQANLPLHTYADIHTVMIEDNALPSSTLVADGVRAADSPMRRIAIKTHGQVGTTRWHPVFDWRKADLVDCFRKHGIRLPVDYNLFGRSFDGLDLRFLLPLKRHRPRDYERVLEWFPLADLEVFRWERANGQG